MSKKARRRLGVTCSYCQLEQDGKDVSKYKGLHTMKPGCLRYEQKQQASPPALLRQNMEGLVKFVQDSITIGGEEDHYRLCCLTADKFDLWTEEVTGGLPNNYFPVWLSRVVEGVLHDIDEASMAV